MLLSKEEIKKEVPIIEKKFNPYSTVIIAQ